MPRQIKWIAPTLAVCAALMTVVTPATAINFRLPNGQEVNPDALSNEQRVQLIHEIRAEIQGAQTRFSSWSIALATLISHPVRTDSAQQAPSSAQPSSSVTSEATATAPSATSTTSTVTPALTAPTPTAASGGSNPTIAATLPTSRKRSSQEAMLARCDEEAARLKALISQFQSCRAQCRPNLGYPPAIKEAVVKFHSDYTASYDNAELAQKLGLSRETLSSWARPNPFKQMRLVRVDDFTGTWNILGPAHPRAQTASSPTTEQTNRMLPTARQPQADDPTEVEGETPARQKMATALHREASALRAQISEFQLRRGQNTALNYPNEIKEAAVALCKSFRFRYPLEYSTAVIAQYLGVSGSALHHWVTRESTTGEPNPQTALMSKWHVKWPSGS